MISHLKKLHKAIKSQMAKAAPQYPKQQMVSDEDAGVIKDSLEEAKQAYMDAPRTPGKFRGSPEAEQALDNYFSQRSTARQLGVEPPPRSSQSHPDYQPVQRKKTEWTAGSAQEKEAERQPLSDDEIAAYKQQIAKNPNAIIDRVRQESGIAIPKNRVNVPDEADKSMKKNVSMKDTSGKLPPMKKLGNPSEQMKDVSPKIEKSNPKIAAEMKAAHADRYSRDSAIAGVHPSVPGEKGVSEAGQVSRKVRQLKDQAADYKQRIQGAIKDKQFGHASDLAEERLQAKVKADKMQSDAAAEHIRVSGEQGKMKAPNLPKSMPSDSKEQAEKIAKKNGYK